MGLTFPPLPPFSPSAPWYLEKIEVVLLSATAPLCWEAHYRGWVGGQGEAAEQRGGGAVATTAVVAGPPMLDPALAQQQQQASAAACVVEMVPDPLAWEEWDMQVSVRGGSHTSPASQWEGAAAPNSQCAGEGHALSTNEDG